jgi:hypothetical protein
MEKDYLPDQEQFQLVKFFINSNVLLVMVTRGKVELLIV